MKEPKRRMILRRKFPLKFLKTVEHPRQEGWVLFSEVKQGESFYLQPIKYVGICFVKTGPRMAQLDNWDDRFTHNQRFPEDFPVYVSREKP